MTRYGCDHCKPFPGAKKRFHDVQAQCPYEDKYDPKVKGAIDKDGNPTSGRRAEPQRPEAAPPSAEPTPGQPRAPSHGGLTSSGRAAEIVPRARTIIKPPEPTDFVVDAIHTRGPINRVLIGVWQLFAWQDDWLEIAEHMPKDQFKLSENADDTIEMDPRNFYSRIVTRICVGLGCKTQQQAHHAIDTFLFFGDWGAFVVMVVKHEMKVIKESPRLKRNAEKKKVKGLTTQQKAGAIPAEGFAMTGQPPVPVTAVTG